MSSQRGAAREPAPRVFSRSAGRTVLCGCRQARRRPAGPKVPWRQAGYLAPGRCWPLCSWGSRCCALGLPRRGLCTTSRPSSLGLRPGARWQPSVTSTPTNRRTSSCCGKVSACRPSSVCPSRCTHAPFIPVYPPSCLSQSSGSPFIFSTMTAFPCFYQPWVLCQ